MTKSRPTAVACGSARRPKLGGRIQEHALRLFLRQGYDATTVEEIASAAGVSHMTFFRYFPTPPGITLELRVQAAAALAAVTVALSAWAQSDGADQLPTLVDRAFHALRRPPVGNDDA